MNKNVLAFLLVGAGVVALYYANKKCDCKNLVTEIPITQEPDNLPNFGRPVVLEQESTVFKNYVDVKTNDFFKPKMSSF